MEPNDLTIELLKSIHSELRKTNERVESIAERLDQMRDELSLRIVESETRTATAIADLAGNVRELTPFLRQTNDLRPRVEQCEDDIKRIKRQLG